MKLDALPPLSSPGLDEEEILRLLGPSLISLINEKGYSVEEIQTELAKMNLFYDEDDINALTQKNYIPPKKHKNTIRKKRERIKN